MELRVKTTESANSVAALTVAGASLASSIAHCGILVAGLNDRICDGEPCGSSRLSVSVTALSHGV